jgi:hypothetical protein
MGRQQLRRAKALDTVAETNLLSNSSGSRRTKRRPAALASVNWMRASSNTWASPPRGQRNLTCSDDFSGTDAGRLGAKLLFALPQQGPPPHGRLLDNVEHVGRHQ